MLKNQIKRSELTSTIKRLRIKGKTVVFTNGVFDILHRGHVEYLTKAKSLGDILVVGLNSDKSVRRLKGKNRPINKQSDRAAVLLGLSSVDYVVIFTEDTPKKLIEEVKPDILVKGADYKIDKIVGADFVKSYGGLIKRIKLSPGRSSSKILKKLL